MPSFDNHAIETAISWSNDIIVLMYRQHNVLYAIKFIYTTEITKQIQSKVMSCKLDTVL